MRPRLSPACRDMLHYRVGRHFQDRFDMGLNVLPWRRYGALRAPRESAIPVGRVRASSKPLAAVFSIVMLAVVASPIVENWKTPAHDDFPLSYYRMFSEERADLQRITYLVGIDTSGEPLSDSVPVRRGGGHESSPPTDEQAGGRGRRAHGSVRRWPRGSRARGVGCPICGPSR